MKRALITPVAILVAVFGLAMFVVGTPTAAQAQSEDDPSQVLAGQTVFVASCAGCHGADGAGVSGLGRPLTGIADQGSRADHITSIRDGKGRMPAFGERLSDDEIEQVASYARLTFAEDAPEPALISEDTELAITGVNTGLLAIIGTTLLAGGAQLVTWSRRRN